MCIANKFYRANQDIDTPEEFNISHWDQVSLKEITENLKDAIQATNQLIEDTGWITATLSSDFKPYGNYATNIPKYRRVGKMVEVRGMVSPKTEISSGIIMTLPVGFRPGAGFNVYQVCQGSGANKWFLNINNSNGELSADRYGITSTGNFPADVWMPFHATFFTDGAVG